MNAPMPPRAPRRTVAIGPAVVLLGAGVAATSLFGLSLTTLDRYDFTSYSFEHAAAASLPEGSDKIFHGFAFWWRWGQLTFGAVLLALAVALVAGVAARVVGLVLAAGTVVFGVLAYIAFAKAPTYRSLQTFRGGDTVLSHASYGVWFGTVGLVVLAVGAVVTAVSARRTAVASPAYVTYPPPGYAAPGYAAPGYPPVSEPPAQRP